MVRVALLALVGCGFSVSGNAPPGDGSATPIDTAIDAPIDTPVLRVSNGLIGFWTFDEANDTVYANDTSGTGQPVPLEVIRTVQAPTFAGGVLDATASGRLVSLSNTHLGLDCRNADAATLEVWVKASAASQGTQLEPSFIAGLTQTVNLRNIALMQGGDRWVAQVRTIAVDGKPNLVSMSPASTTAMTHVVVVANGTTRSLVINGVVEATSVAGSLAGWDASYPMTVVDEVQHARQWLGSVALVALYKRALTTVEIQQNFAAGPNN